MDSSQDLPTESSAAPRERVGLEILVDFDRYSNEKQGKHKKEGRGASGMLTAMDMVPFGNGKAMESDGSAKDGLRGFIYPGDG